ncbi:MAG: hypothetical protein OXC44_08065 [Proteobacteria bacterium]|nr:hypothetical protein [Pseudomonadota bacterium]
MLSQKLSQKSIAGDTSRRLEQKPRNYDVFEKMSLIFKKPSRQIYNFLEKGSPLKIKKAFQKEKTKKKEASEKSTQLQLQKILAGVHPQEETLEEEARISGLSKSLGHIITQLMKCQQLSQQEFCAVVRQLMEQGVVEEINEWNHEYLDLDDDFLRFDNTQKIYQVHPKSMEALQEKKDLRHLISDAATQRNKRLLWGLLWSLRKLMKKKDDHDTKTQKERVVANDRAISNVLRYISIRLSILMLA